MSENSEQSFFEKLIDSIFSKSDPEAIKRKKLKQISKALSKTRFKFYKSSSDQLLPAFAKFFYELYKVTYPCQVAFNNRQNPTVYKMMVIDHAFTENQKNVIDELTEEAITTLSSNTPFDQLKKKVNENIGILTAEIDKTKIAEIDNLYSKLMAFKQFCMFDFYFMLKKFDSTMHEGELNRTPKFNTIDASYVAEDMKDFISVAWALPLNDSWDDLMSMFKSANGVEPIKPTQWNKIVSRLEQIRKSQTFEMIIQLTTKNPDFFSQVDAKKENVAEAYIDKVKTQAQLTIRKLESEQKNSKIDSIITQIFNTTAIISTKYYTEQASAAFTKKGLTGYEFAKPLNYLKSFLVEYCKKEVRTYADLVLIRGKWTSAELSKNMSDSYNGIMEGCEKIIDFDKKHNEEGGEFGTKLKTLLPRVDRDKESMNIMKTTLRDSNALAKQLIMNTTRNLVAFAKSTRTLIDDYKKPRPELVSNWKELERFAETPINEQAVAIYKKIYLVVNLMQNFMQK